MRLHRLLLTDFRNFTAAELVLAPSLTAVVGDNGQGKSNIVEAIAYLATLDSFRGAPLDALVRDGEAQAVVRAEAERDGRALLIEADLQRSGRNHTFVNRQRLQRARDLLGALRVVVFSPDDLAIVKGGPTERRRYLDDLLVATHVRNDRLRADVDRILRQRNALLRQAGARSSRGRLEAEAAATLDVWDAQLVDSGTALAQARLTLVAALEPALGKAYDQLAGTPADVSVRYDPPWLAGGLGPALLAARDEDMRRGVTSVGPHRDDLALGLGGRPARTHASQGEQRCLALALRLAAHGVIREAARSAPVLLLDDVFSELDPERAGALLRSLPDGQVVLTTAGPLPAGARPERVVRVVAGQLR